MTKKTWCAVFLFLIYGAPLTAADAPLTLDQAVSRALERNPNILRARTELEAAKWRRLQAGSFPNPDLVFSQEGISAAGGEGEKEVSLGIEQFIEFPGKRSLRQDAARLEEEGLAAGLERVKRVVGADVRKAYLRTAYAQKAIAGLEELLTFLEQYLEMATVRFEAGQVSSLDVLRGRLESLQVRNELVEARRQLRENRLALYLLMGEDGEEDEPVADELSFRPLEADLVSLQNLALFSAALQADALRLEQARAGTLLARKNPLPDLKIGLYYPSLRRSAWGFSVGATIPLWNQYKGEILEAESVSRQMSLALDARKQRVRSAVRRLYADVKAAEAQLNLFEKSMLSSIESMLELGTADYQYGKIDSLNLFDLYKLYKGTQREYLTAVLNHEIALVDLETTGELD
jgi:cobalt-zinc-cadmium efflux system outer membrane protein